MRGGSRSRSSSPPPPRGLSATCVRPMRGPTIGMDQHPLGGTDGSRDRTPQQGHCSHHVLGRHCVQLYIADRNCNVPGSEMDDYWDYDGLMSVGFGGITVGSVRSSSATITSTQLGGRARFRGVNLLRQRRTTLLNLDGRVICFTDCWTFTEPNEQLRSTSL